MPRPRPTPQDPDAEWMEVPLPPGAVVPPESVSVAELTELTAVVTVDGVAEAWVMNRMEDTMQKLRVGDHLSAGWFQGEIVEIEGDDVVLDSDGDRWLLTRGDPLSEAIALPPEY